MAIEQSLPDAVGAFIGWLVHESGWKVTTRQAPDTPEPVKPGHICILFRRFVSFGTDVTRAYVDALEARGGATCWWAAGLSTIAKRSRRCAPRWPPSNGPTTSCRCLRRCAGLCSRSATRSCSIPAPHGRAFHPFRVPAELPAHLSSIGLTLTTLARLHTLRNRRPVAETVMRLLDHTRAHVGFALRRSGEQVLANVLHVAELARQHERNDGLSFRGFVETLREAAERGDATEAPIVEDGSDGVRLMTVHKAKGLEFPVVVLADITPTGAARGQPLDRRRARPLRAADWRMVAQGSAGPASRGARPRPGRGRAPGLCGCDSRPGSAGRASRGRRAARRRMGQPAEPRRVSAAGPSADGGSAASCPAFKRDSVIERPDGGIASATTVSPGLHRMGGDISHEVVWWDLGAASRCRSAVRVAARGIDREGCPAAGDRRGHAGLRRLACGAEAALANGRTPWVAVSTMTEWTVEDAAGVVRSSRRAGRAPEAEVVTIARSGRPAGARFGTLVHAALATVSLEAGPEERDALVATNGRIVGATAEECPRPWLRWRPCWIRCWRAHGVRSATNAATGSCRSRCSMATCCSKASPISRSRQRASSPSWTSRPIVPWPRRSTATSARWRCMPRRSAWRPASPRVLLQV